MRPSLAAFSGSDLSIHTRYWADFIITTFAFRFSVPTRSNARPGARGLGSIMEAILLDTMFDVPTLDGLDEVLISQQFVEGTAAIVW